MQEKKEYASINLPKEIVDELKLWKVAFAAAYGRSVSYGEMIKGMLVDIKHTAPSVHEEFRGMLERNPELRSRAVSLNESSNGAN